VDGVDASTAMLDLAGVAAARAGEVERVAFHRWYLPDDAAPRDTYDLAFSNSLLHHLADPAALWSWLRAHLASGTPFFAMDLLRPDSPDAARRLVDQYAAGEPEVLRTDFYNSLRAAYRPDEVRLQLTAASLDALQIAVVSDRHFIVSGTLR
jgi:SAM-dependent methyltransferase